MPGHSYTFPHQINHYTVTSIYVGHFKSTSSYSCGNRALAANDTQLRLLLPFLVAVNAVKLPEAALHALQHMAVEGQQLFSMACTGEHVRHIKPYFSENWTDMKFLSQWHVLTRIKVGYSIAHEHINSCQFNLLPRITGARLGSGLQVGAGPAPTEM